MDNPHWPLFGLRVRTPRLELRLPTDEDMVALIAAIDDGIHDPSTMPFLHPFTDTPVPRRRRDSLQHWWRARAEWRPDHWNFTGAVVVGGRPVGCQDLLADDFGRLRSVRTGSWLARTHQGRGLGKEMRAAILHLAFAGLGAEEALSGAFWDNAASLGTSRSLGYEDNGEQRALRRDVPDRTIGLRLTRDRWSARQRQDIEIEGLGPCLELFGVPATAG